MNTYNTYKLVIAEKPSVAKTIAHVLGAKNYETGCYTGNGYIVSWCYGHLVELAYPEAYTPLYKRWSLTTLPILPDAFKYVVSQGSAKKQFSILKKLMNDKRTSAVINACDAGREGESIFRLVYIQAKCKKPMYRLWTSSLEDKALREAFTHLQPSENYDNLFYAAQARLIADWLVGINLTRLYTLTNPQHAMFSVGRVQTPTVNLIAARDDEIKNFIKQKYFTVKLGCKGFTLTSERIDSRLIAERMEHALKAQSSIKLTSISQKDKVTAPDKLYDLTTLQREANKKYGLSAQATLTALQSLYEKKLTSYPRTDSRYLTDDMKDTAQHLLHALEPHLMLDDKNFQKLFDSSKVSDHYAVIPTLNACTCDLDMLNLTDNELRILALVRAKFVSAAAQSLIESVTTVSFEYEGIKFSTTGKVIKQQGWTQYSITRDKKKADIHLPSDLTCETLYPLECVSIEEKFTQPKAHYTEDTLLKAMETAGTEALDKDIEVERKGLGTPATRAGIIENIISKGFVARDKKQLTCTAKGYKLLSIVAPSFKDARMTSEWENKLSRIADGKGAPATFIENISEELTKVILRTKNI